MEEIELRHLQLVRPGGLREIYDNDFKFKRSRLYTKARRQVK